jgi:hypothetical protein
MDYKVFVKIVIVTGKKVLDFAILHTYIFEGRFMIYKLLLPIGEKHLIQYENDNDKLNIINNLLSDQSNYVNEHWIWEHAFEKTRVNFEDKSKGFLNRCADFLLLGELDRNGILSSHKIKNIRGKEIPISSTAKNTQELVYGQSTDNDQHITQKSHINFMHNNEIIMGNIDPDAQIKYHKKREDIIKKRYTQSQQYKIKKLFSTSDKVSKVYAKITNGELADIVSDGKPRNKELNEQELVKWRNRPFKNIYGENVYNLKDKIYSGNKGYIDRDKPYLSKWCYVNNDNIFTFYDCKYRIDRQLEQYRVGEDNQSEQDMILVFEQFGKQYYFDMKIVEIKDKYISRL